MTTVLWFALAGILGTAALLGWALCRAAAQADADAAAWGRMTLGRFLDEQAVSRASQDVTEATEEADTTAEITFFVAWLERRR